MDVRTEVKEQLAKLLNLKIEDISDLSGIANLKGWDSINHFRIIVALESHFKVTFTNYELVYLDTVQKITALISARIIREPN